EKHYEAFPAEFVHWAPASWDGVPSEAFTAIEQICHVRDIEVEGYQVRFRRTLDELSPLLPSIDSETVAKQRNYGSADPATVFADFRAAREQTLVLLRRLSEPDLDRPAVFEGYGPVTMRALIHYLCSHDQQHLAGLQWLLGKIDAERHRT
ncbi:MAG TPA: DinB family protein, partial [Steroidobacteraceae bacterium]